MEVLDAQFQDQDRALVPVAAQAALDPQYATLSIAWERQQMGDLQQPVAYDATEAQIKTWAAEAVRNGSVPGIDADPNVNFDSYIVDRRPAKDGLPNRITIRPKTTFGF